MRNNSDGNNSERNLVRLMPPNTVMGYLQRHHPEFLTPSGAIDATCMPTVRQVQHAVQRQITHLFPGDYREDGK